MSAKNNEQPAKPKSNTWIVPAVMAVFVAGIFFWAMNQSKAPAPQSAVSNGPVSSGPVASLVPEINDGSVPTYFPSAEAAKPYPQTLPPQQFPNPVVAHAYRVAQQIPGVLAQQPCYCYCSRTEGHRGLLDCYASLHASACSVCIAEALLADKLTREGRTPAEIRAAIIRGDWRTVELN
jgi:hypothetical protein